MKKICIVCQCSTNKGDRAIAEYLIDRVGKMGNSQVILSTTAPSLWNNLPDNVRVIGTGYKSLFPKINSFNLRRIVTWLTSSFYSWFVYPNLIKSKSHWLCKCISADFIGAISDSDLVIVTGGHHITSIRSKNSLFSITYDIGLVSLFAKRYVLWSQTIGPLEFSNLKVKDFFGDVLRKAQVVFIRDENSIKCIQSTYGNLGNIKKSYDSVFGFGNIEYGQYENREKKVGISIFNGLKKAKSTFGSLALMLDHFVQRGYSIEFFCMEYGSAEIDDIEQVASMMKEKGDVKIFQFLSSTREHLAELSKCSFYIGYKTHSVIMALTTATPLIAICYHEKTKDFMSDFNLLDFAFSDTCLDSNTLLHKIDFIIQNSESMHTSMKSISVKIADRVAIDFDQVLDSI